MVALIPDDQISMSAANQPAPVRLVLPDRSQGAQVCFKGQSRGVIFINVESPPNAPFKKVTMFFDGGYWVKRHGRTWAETLGKQRRQATVGPLVECVKDGAPIFCVVFNEISVAEREIDKAAFGSKATTVKYYPVDGDVRSAQRLAEQDCFDFCEARTRLDRISTEQWALANVNHDDAQTIAERLNISLKSAAAIVAYRTEHGPIATIEDLKSVKGIGQQTCLSPALSLANGALQR